jgi:AhpD family alkylhydroperoxidase
VSAERIAPGDRREVGILTLGMSHAAGRIGRHEPMKLFLILGRHRWLFRGWLFFAGRLMPGGRLARRETELVILRVATLRDCRYELEHHTRLGRRAGLSDADFQRVTEGPDAAGWSPREQAVMNAVEALHRDGDLDDPTWEELRRHLDERESIELLMLVGHYEMLATTIAALRIEPERKRGKTTRL